MPHDTELLKQPPHATASPSHAECPEDAGVRDSARHPLDTRGTSGAIQDAAGDGDADVGDLDTELRGLDRLQTVVEQRTPWWRRAIDGVLPPVLLVVVLVAAWQAYTVIAEPRPDLAPGPLDVAAALGQAWDDGRLQLAVATSLERGILGFAIAVAVGTPLGLLMAEWAPLRRALGPLVSGLQVLPSVAWVPAAILWFGMSDATVYFVVLMGAIPSIVNGLVAGVAQVPPQLRRVGTVLGASRLQLAASVVLPAALPGYLAGLKQGWAFSWRSLMAAEIIAFGGSIGFGVGSLLQQGRDLADLAGVLGTVLVILAIGVVIELLVFAPIERGLLRRRGLTGGTP